MSSVNDGFKGASQNDNKTEKSVLNEWSSSVNAIDGDVGSSDKAEEEIVMIILILSCLHCNDEFYNRAYM